MTDLAMEARPAGGFWRGPVTRYRQARSIIKATGVTYLAIGGFLAFSLLLAARGGSAPRSGGPAILLLVAILFGGPGGFLLNRRNRASAIAALITGLMSLLGALALTVAAVRAGAGGAALAPALVAGLPALIITWLSWRAYQATSALPGLPPPLDMAETSDAQGEGRPSWPGPLPRDWPRGWEVVAPRRYPLLQKRLAAAAAPGHPLHDLNPKMLARRLDGDEALLGLDDGRVAQTEAGWVGQPAETPNWPKVTLFPSLGAWFAAESGEAIGEESLGALGPQPGQRRGSIWVGPVAGLSQANRTIAAAGWTFVAIGGLAGVSALTAGGANGFMTVTNFFMLAIFLIPGGLLLVRRTPTAAGLTFAISLVILGLEAIGLITMLPAPGFGAVLVPAVLGGLMFGAIARLCWRALLAARFLKTVRHTAVFD